MNRKIKIIIQLLSIGGFLAVITWWGFAIDENMLQSDFSVKNLKPSFQYPFGTDWLGRDMFLRTIKGLSLSMTIGIVASAISAIFAMVIGVAAGTMPKWVDDIISFVIDLVMSIPHIVLLILISFSVGGGAKGILIGIVFTHWTSLARLIRGEVLHLKEEQYVKSSKQLGKSKTFIMFKHIMPHLVPQFIVGIVILFPHAILHEAAVTFLGFGIPPEQPAIGIILSESMNYLSSGFWWLAFFPGLCLVCVVLAFDRLGENLKMLLDPKNAQE